MPTTLQGRPFGPAELAPIPARLCAQPTWSRYQLSGELARRWQWQTAAGRLKGSRPGCRRGPERTAGFRRDRIHRPPAPRPAETRRPVREHRRRRSPAGAGNLLAQQPLGAPLPPRRAHQRDPELNPAPTELFRHPFFAPRLCLSPQPRKARVAPVRRGPAAAAPIPRRHPWESEASLRPTCCGWCSAHTAALRENSRGARGFYRV